MTKPLISVLVVCYNNQKYIGECLRSIFRQTYPNIEILIGDDCSESFDAQSLIRWINENRTPNIQKLAVFQNETNMGTVANLENLQDKSSGEFLFNIAADDALYDGDVLENLYERALEAGEDAEVIVAETELWDTEFRKVIGSFITPETAEFIKRSTPRDLFAACARRIILPASFLYRRSVLEKVGRLSGQYRLVEDCPAHLRLLAQGVKPVFMGKTPSIKHRDGGISHGNTLQSKKAFLTYFNDIINLYPNEIEPHLDLLTEAERAEMLTLYHDRIRAYYKIHLPAYYKASAEDVEEANKALKAEEQAGHLPPSPDSVGKILAAYKTREFIKAAAYKWSRKEIVLAAAVLMLLCFIAAGCITLMNTPFTSFISVLLLILGCAAAVFGLGAAAVNILLRIRRRRHGW